MLFKVRIILFWFMCMIGGLGVSALSAQTLQQIQAVYHPDMSNGLIYISKHQLKLTLYSTAGEEVVSYPIACGKVKGTKRHKGDYRTPEGLFQVQQIEDSHAWGHDFHDGNGFIPHAYGPWFMRLRTGFDGIGIHGTHAPESIGSRATEGCIRVENNNLAALRQLVKEGMAVIIGPEDGYLYEGMTFACAFSSNKAVRTPAQPLEVIIGDYPLSALEAKEPALTQLPRYILFN